MVSVNKLILVITLVISLLIFFLNYSNTNADQQINIYADEIKVNKTGEKVNAVGDVIVINNHDVKIKSDNIFYDKQKGNLDAFGNVILNDEVKNTFFFDIISFDSTIF